MDEDQICLGHIYLSPDNVSYNSLYKGTGAGEVAKRLHRYSFLTFITRQNPSAQGLVDSLLSFLFLAVLPQAPPITDGIRSGPTFFAVPRDLQNHSITQSLIFQPPIHACTRSAQTQPRALQIQSPVERPSALRSSQTVGGSQPWLQTD